MNTNLLTALGIGGLGVSVLFSSLDSGRTMRIFQAESVTASQVSTQLEGQSLEAQSELAESRYQSGLCYLAAHPINEGQEVLNPPVPGSFICDRYGVTGVIDRRGKVINLARTNDLEIVQEGLK